MDRESFDKLWDSLSEIADPAIEKPRYREGRYIQQDYTEVWEFTQRLSALNPQKGLEIGNHCGGTTLVWQAVAPEIVSIDLEPAGSSDGTITLDLFPDVKFILGDSHNPDILEQAAEFALYDFLFIDGDHTREGVRMDYEMYAPLVRKGGIIAFHDWGYQAASPSHYPIRECVASTGIIPEIIQHSHFGIAVLRVPHE